MPKLPQYPFAEKFAQWKKDLLKLWADLYKFRDIFKANFELGKKHYGLGNFSDAVLRFKFVVWLEPKYAAGWYWLGLSHLALAQKPAAIKALKKATEIRPDWQEAHDALNSAQNSDSKNV